MIGGTISTNSAGITSVIIAEWFIARARRPGDAFGTGAFLSSLRRTRSGDFRVENCLSPDACLQLLA